MVQHETVLVVITSHVNRVTAQVPHWQSSLLYGLFKGWELASKLWQYIRSSLALDWVKYRSGQDGTT